MYSNRNKKPENIQSMSRVMNKIKEQVDCRFNNIALPCRPKIHTATNDFSSNVNDEHTISKTGLEYLYGTIQQKLWNSTVYVPELFICWERAMGKYVDKEMNDYIIIACRNRNYIVLRKVLLKTDFALLPVHISKSSWISTDAIRHSIVLRQELKKMS